MNGSYPGARGTCACVSEGLGKVLSPDRMNSRCKSPEMKKATGLRGAER